MSILSTHTKKGLGLPIGCCREMTSAFYCLLVCTFPSALCRYFLIFYLFRNGVRYSLRKNETKDKAIFGIHAALCNIHVGDCLSDMQ